MPRQPRFLEPKLPYHVTQRGNYRQDVFANDDDRGNYLELLAKYSTKYELEIRAYCLMDNHVHLLAWPRTDTALSRTLAVTHMVYAQHLHRRTGIMGHLWQGRFFSCALDDEHMMQAARYIEMNPVRAGLVRKPEEWEWSSARHHLGLRHDDLLANAQWPDEELLRHWAELLEHEDTETELDRLRHATKKGRPLGSDAWIEELERKTGRRLRPLPRGRPRKS